MLRSYVVALAVAFATPALADSRQSCKIVSAMLPGEKSAYVGPGAGAPRPMFIEITADSIVLSIGRDDLSFQLVVKDRAHNFGMRFDDDEMSTISWSASASPGVSLVEWTTVTPKGPAVTIAECR